MKRLIAIVLVALLIPVPVAEAKTRHRTARHYTYYQTDVYRGQMTKMKSALGLHYHSYRPRKSKGY